MQSDKEAAKSLIKTVEVYSISNCHFCNRAKEVLSQLEIPFTEINCDARSGDANAEAGVANREALYARAPDAPRQFPQIFINGQRIGGYDGLTVAFTKIGLIP